jgi:mannosyltransferase
MPVEVRQDSDPRFRDRPISSDMNPPASSRPREPTPALLLTALTLFALALRFWRLGKWSLDSDEVFMLRDSLEPSPINPRPLLYFLNHYLVSPFMPLDEFGLRLLPAIFGVLAIPVFYLVARRLVGSRAALFGALLLTLNPLHVYYSQFARYWSLVFLLSAVYPYAVYIGVRERNRRTLALGLVTGVLASLAHPSSVIMIGGLLVWVVATYLTRDQLRHLWGQRRVRWGALVGSLVLSAVIVLRFVPMLKGWIYHKTPGGVFLFHMPNKPGLGELSYLLSFVESTTVPLVLAAVAGIYVLWQIRDRSLGILLTSLFIFQLAFLTLVRLTAPISTFYLVPVVPVLFIGAGVFLDQLAAMDWKLRPSWLFPATVAVIMLAAGAPTLISQYLDGRRWDFRAVAHWLKGPLVPGDIVFSDQAGVLTHYLPGTKVERLTADPARLGETVRLLQQSGPKSSLWVVAPAPSHAFRTNPNLGSLSRWLYDYCQLRNSIGVGRVDFRQQYLEIFRCPRG